MGRQQVAKKTIKCKEFFMKKIGVLLIGFLLLVSVGLVNASVLDFESLTTSNAESLSLNNQGYGGFTWDNTWYLYSDNVFSTPAHSGDYAIVNNFGANPAGLSIASSSTFDFNGVWIAGWDFDSPQQIKVQGFDASNNLIGETAWLAVTSGVNSYLDANFQNVTRIDFVGGQYFTLDDFTYNESLHTPEPATFMLFGLGLLGLAGVSRKKK